MVHPGLAHLESSEEGRAWLGRLPELLMDCEDAWELTAAGQPFEYAHASLALPVKDRSGADAVLKIQFPHRECEHEGDALALWNGEGAVQLFVRSFERSALLLERCFPGTPLASRDADYALNVLIDLLPRLWKPASEPFTTLADEASWWLSDLPESWEQAGRPCERRLLDAALDALRGLPPTQGEQVLLHQDLHGDNVLAAEREPWLVIDPKPLVGEREFGVAPIVRSFELGERRRDVLGRFERVTSELQLDVERARGWTIGQTLAWAFNGGEASSWHLQVAAWLIESK